MTHRLRNNIKMLLCGLFVSLLFIPISIGGLQKVHAQGMPVFDAASVLQSTLTALSSASLEQKELIWDGLFYEIANQALQQMTSDILEWVNSGFDGKPMFITDLLGYLEEIAQEIAADFIYGDQFSEACTPIQLNARIAIAEIVQLESEEFDGFKKKAACTIDDIPGGNSQAFLNGTFTAGGWSMWFEAVLNPVNTPIGLEAAGRSALNSAQEKKKEEEKNKYLANGGFKNQEACEVVDGKRKCTTVTPGSIIKEMTSQALGAPLERLINADEIDEVIGALFSNLAQQALSGVNGLLGLGGNSAYASLTFGANGNESYLDAVRKEQSNGGGSASGNKIEEALRTETQVLELQLAIISELDEISNTFLDAREPFENDSCWNLELPEAFSDKLDELTAEVPTTVETVITLESMRSSYEESESSKEQLQLLQQLSSMQSEGKLSGRTAVIQYENYLRNELRGDIEDFTEEIEDEEDSC